TRNRKTTSTVEYEIGKSVSNVMQAAGGIKRLTASVTIAAHFDGQGADRKLVPRTPEELAKLRHVVESAVGIQTGANNSRGDDITPEELPFNDQFAADITRELDQQRKHQFLSDILQNYGYPAAAVLALIVLIVIFKRSPVQEIPLGVPVGRLVGNQAGTA